MEDYYNGIKDNLENRPELFFNEEAWKTMEDKLNQHEQSQAQVVVWPWWSYALLALLPLSMLLNGWLLFHQAGDSTSSTIAQNTVFQPDTIVQTQVIYKTDTLIQTQYVKHFVEGTGSSSSYSWYPQMALDMHQTAGRFGGILASQGTVPSYTTAISPTELNQQINWQVIKAGLGPAATGSYNREEDESDLGLPLLPAVSTQVLDSPRKPIQDIDMKGLPISTFVYTPAPIWERLKPQGIAIGTQMGGLIPITEELADPHAFQRSFQVKLQLPNRWSLWGELGLLDVKYRVQETGERVDIQAVDPPTANFDFQHVQVWQERTHLVLGLEYAFATRGKGARPIVAAGYNALGFKPYEIFYEFKDLDTDTEIQVEQTIDRTDGPAHYVATKAGYQWLISRQVLWELSLHYRHALKGNRFTNPSMVGLTTSFSMQF